VFDQIAVHEETAAVQTCQFDHGKFLSRLSSAEEVRVNSSPRRTIHKDHEDDVLAKVPEDIADEVWERGAFRKVNRVL
jgi:hypothetical protein